MSPPTRVLKFGGTSVQDFAAMQDVARIIKQQLSPRMLVVTSATAGTTDLLVQLGKAIREQDRENFTNCLRKIDTRHSEIHNAIKNNYAFSDEAEDRFSGLLTLLKDTAHQLFSSRQINDFDTANLWSFGELLSSSLLCEIIRAHGMNARFFDARVVLITSDAPLNGQPHQEKIDRAVQEKLSPAMEKNVVCVTQGFIGRDAQGRATTLGRGGSDYSATILGAALEADQIEIWTDVNGVMTADPRIVPEAQMIERLSFREASELAYFGAKVLHPFTLLPAMGKNIPVIVKNTKNPAFKGTTILPEDPASTRAEICSIAYKRRITIFVITSTRMLMAHGFLSKVFDVFNAYKTPVDVVATSEVSVSMTVDDDTYLEEIRQALSQYGKTEIITNQSIVCLVGHGLYRLPGVAARTFGAIADTNVRMISYCAGKDNLSFIVDETALPVVVSNLHEMFFENSAGKQQRKERV